MLQVTIPAGEFFNESSQEFERLDKPVTLQMEHSLLSISKWESKTQKAFLKDEAKTVAETIEYFKCMTINKVDESVYKYIPTSVFAQVNDYVASHASATYINQIQKPTKGQTEVLTSELLYYYMFSLNIPIECERWHVNRLITLIHVFDAKAQQQNARAKGRRASNTNKMSIAERRALMNQRREQANSKGK